MPSKKIISAGAGGCRQKLTDILPLEAPLILQIFPAYLCNFKCNYCVFSVPEKKRGFISAKKLLDYDLYLKCINDMNRFRTRIKVLRFAGMGEPLLHKNIVEMIEYAEKQKVAEKTELITNASLLTPEISEKLAASGLSRLLISIEGLSDKHYKKISDTKINFLELLEKIKYFYKHKKNTFVHVKIINTALKNEKEKEKFFETFKNISDSMGIENVVPLYPCVNFKKILKKNLEKTQYGINIQKGTVCPQAFYTCQINPDGLVVPCYSIVYPDIMGNVNQDSIYDIWHGRKFYQFRQQMLDGLKKTNETCKNCTVMTYRLFPEDDLSNDIPILKQKYLMDWMIRGIE